MAIDLGNIPTGSPPTAGEKLQIRSAIGVGPTDAPTFLAQSLTGNGSNTSPSLKVGAGAYINGWYSFNGLQLNGVVNSINAFGITAAGTNISNGHLSFGIGNLKLEQDADNILAQRNGTAKQTLRIYNTYTSATVYERAVMDWNGPTPGNLQIGTEFLGSGSGMAARPIDFVVGGVVRMSISGAGLVTLDTITINRGTGTNTNNICIGNGGLGSNTTGVNNSAFGFNSLFSNSSGSANSAFGVSVLVNNGSGSSNSAFGSQTLQGNTTGYGNSAFGAAALVSNTTGYSNSAFGIDAGRFIAGGVTTNATGENSTFLGASTKALAAGQTNQTVIGYNVTGSGSNSTTLNNTSATLTKINGTSAHVLDVTGTIRLSPPASVTPANNGELMVEATSNTTLTFKFKGSDGTVRSGTVILA